MRADGVDAEALQLGSGDLKSSFPRLNRARGRKSNCWMAFPPDHTENAAGKVHSNVVGEPSDMCCLSVLGHTFQFVHNSGPFRSRP